jgi:hypothetical protein
MKIILSLVIFIAIGFTFQRFINKEGLCKRHVEPALVDYINEWKQDMKKAGIDYGNVFDRIDNIYFKNNTDNRLGYSTYAKREIWVSASLRSEPYLIRASLYHELGHYVFQLDHSDGIMASNKIGSNDFYEKNWNKLLTDYMLKCKD